MIVTTIIFAYGYRNIYQIVRTEYNISSEKKIRSDGYKVVLLSDLHYGITLNYEQLTEIAARIKKEKPDMVILDGDIVDENTTSGEMNEAFLALGGINSTYGTFYVYGNHDKNLYSSKPQYTERQLKETIKKAGIHILEDSVADINQELILIGRADKSDGDSHRKTIADLVKGLNNKMEWVVLDHQPTEYAEVEKQKCDLILSGHTHAGQIWPAGVFIDLFQRDGMNYGYSKSGKLNRIVTSGLAGWGYPVRTEKHSEYVVININSNK